MNANISLLIYLVIGTLGGLLGAKLKIPAGVLIGALLSVMLFKVFVDLQFRMPRSFNFIVQVLLGVMVASTFQPAMLKTLKHIALPVLFSTIVLVGAGIVLAIIFSKLALVDPGTAYISTSPGAMSVLIAMSLDSHSDPMIVTSFHFFRVLFILFTAPLVFKYFFA